MGNVAPTIKEMAATAEVSERTIKKVKQANRIAPDKIGEIMAGKTTPNKIVNDWKRSRPDLNLSVPVTVTIKVQLENLIMDTLEPGESKQDFIRSAIVTELVARQLEHEEQEAESES